MDLRSVEPSTSVDALGWTTDSKCRDSPLVFVPPLLTADADTGENYVDLPTFSFTHAQYAPDLEYVNPFERSRLSHVHSSSPSVSSSSLAPRRSPLPSARAVVRPFFSPMSPTADDDASWSTLPNESPATFVPPHRLRSESFSSILPESLGEQDSATVGGDRDLRVLSATCAVCLDDSCPVDMKLLPCQHRFHAVCITPWVESSFSCPMCRSHIQLFVPLEQRFSAFDLNFMDVYSHTRVGHSTTPMQLQEAATALAGLTTLWEDHYLHKVDTCVYFSVI